MKLGIPLWLSGREMRKYIKGIKKIPGSLPTSPGQTLQNYEI
jgi:hypothetical protein